MGAEDTPLENCPFCGSEMYLEYSYYSGDTWLKHKDDRRCIMHTIQSGINLDFKKKPKSAQQILELWNTRAGGV